MATLWDAIAEAHDNAIATHGQFAEGPVNLWPEVVAATHDNAIVAHNRSVSRQRAAMTEDRRFADATVARVRWERLCRRWAAKHSGQ
jgi:hypothetical protein